MVSNNRGAQPSRLTAPERPARAGTVSACRRGARFLQAGRLNRRNRTMRNIVKLLIALGFAVALSGCVVAPVGPPRPYVAMGVVAPAPVVVVHGYYGRW